MSIKLLLLGDSGVGKTTLIHKYLQLPTANIEPTIGIETKITN